MRQGDNPYPNRKYPVGRIKFKPSGMVYRSIKTIIPASMLEYGEPELLYYLPKIAGGGEIVNLGHAKGGSAILMAKGLRDYNLKGFIHSVDLFDGVYSNLEDAEKRVKDHNVDYLIKLYIGSTIFWGKNFQKQGKKFSLVFIDADHSYEGVKEDFKIWSTMLNFEGIIALHDTNQDYTYRVLEEEILNNKVWKELKCYHINRIRVFQKVKR